MILNGDCLLHLKHLENNSIDSLVTDPPAGISFMGKAWDDDKGGRKQWIAWMTEVMQECLRVLKPGAHGLVWTLPRTSHWTGTALEDAGFEVRDVVTHLFGTGFPKSLNISKAIDKAAGVDREITMEGTPNPTPGIFDKRNSSTRPVFGNPLTEAAKQWDGWGTALKPASEHWILVRKPCSEKTIAANVLKWGVGGLNIDASRIISDEKLTRPSTSLKSGNALWSDDRHPTGEIGSTNGRFPANLVLSHSEHCTDEQCDIECAIKGLNDQNNGTSRFFYCAKASRADKNAGCEGLPEKETYVGHISPTPMRDHRKQVMKANHHPTVKSTKLMQYLIRMITPPKGIVLDPFTGSGSTGVAAIKEGFDFIGIEQNEEYSNIAKARINEAHQYG